MLTRAGRVEVYAGYSDGVIYIDSNAAQWTHLQETKNDEP